MMKELVASGFNILTRNNADVIFSNYQSHDRLVNILRNYTIDMVDITGEGGSKSVPTKKLEYEFNCLGWGPENVKIFSGHRFLNSNIQTFNSNSTHEIDHFIVDDLVAIEIEWNTKDTFFDRDLSAFRVLYDMNIINVGIIITRGEELQNIIRNKKFSSSTTHWKKLVNKIDLGISGKCPIIAIGLPANIIHHQKEI